MRLQCCGVADLWLCKQEISNFDMIALNCRVNIVESPCNYLKLREMEKVKETQLTSKI